jgi:hypothetical protein
VCSLSVHEDGVLAAAGCRDGTVLAWDMRQVRMQQHCAFACLLQMQGCAHMDVQHSFSCAEPTVTESMCCYHCCN